MLSLCAHLAVKVDWTEQIGVNIEMLGVVTWQIL